MTHRRTRPGKLEDVAYSKNVSQRQLTTITLGRQGRIVIPAATRRRLGIDAGDELNLIEENGHVVLETRAAAAARAQGMSKHLATDVSVVDELIAERREEARREDERDAAWRERHG